MEGMEESWCSGIMTDHRGPWTYRSLVLGPLEGKLSVVIEQTCGE